MTAEVAILNREGVSLAADSAVTLTGEHGQKIYTSANKIFQLSKRDPVGIMIYDAATIADVAWEIIIKRYRDHLGDRSFPTLGEYVADFRQYLNAQMATYFPADLQLETFVGSVHGYLHLLDREIEQAQAAATQKAGHPLSVKDIAVVVRNVIDQNHSLVVAGPEALDLPADYTKSLNALYGRRIKPAIDLVLGHKYALD